jgi:glycerol-3-phosphate dehydrogenase
MREPLTEALRDWYEVAVIGGGINGAGIAQALAQAGYSVALLERGDFGSGTTSRSTRLIHGGLRYLEHAEFGLVYESLREREALFKLYPHLVKPLELLLPIYKGGAYPKWKAWAGLTLYDLLSSAGQSFPRHRNLSSPETLEREPLLRPSGLRAGFCFWDGQVHLAERLAIEAALAAGAAGASVANYAEVKEIRLVSTAPGRNGFALEIEDVTRGASQEITADMVINATGPWVDAVLSRAGLSAPRQIGGTRGSHLVLRPGALELGQAIYAPAFSDGRPFFVVPWLGMTLVGTTDIRHDDAEFDAIAPSEEEVAYLLAETNSLLRSSVSRTDVLYTYCGVRPLPYEQEGKEGKVTRRHFLVDHEQHGFPGLYSLVGGKLTTHRSVGRRAVDAVRKRLGDRWPNRPTDAAQGDAPLNFQAVWGRRAPEVYARYQNEPALLEPICEHSPEPLAALTEAARHELATNLADVFLRRTLVGWRECQGLDVAESAAQLIGKELGWDKRRRDDEVQRYRCELSVVHPSLASASEGATHPLPV